MVNIAQRVTPDIEDPTLYYQLQAIRSKGQVPSAAQQALEGVSKTIEGVSTAIDKLYSRQAQDLEIEQRQLNLSIAEQQKQKGQIELNRSLALEEARTEKERAILEKDIAAATLAKETAVSMQNTYRLSRDPNPLKRMELFTDPANSEFISRYPEHAKQLADDLYTKHPQFRSTLKENFYDRIQKKQSQKEQQDRLNTLNKAEEKAEFAYLKEPDINHIDIDKFKDATVIQTPKGPDLRFNDGTLFSTTILSTDNKQRATSKAINMYRHFEKLERERAKALATSPEKKSKVVKRIAEENIAEKEYNTRMQTLSSVSTTANPRLKNIAQRHMRFLEEARKQGKSYAQALKEELASAKKMEDVNSVASGVVNVIKRAIQNGIAEKQIKAALTTKYGIADKQAEQLISAAKTQTTAEQE